MSRVSPNIQIWWLPAVLTTILGFASLAAWAQVPPATQPTESDELALDQSKLSDRYERVEKLILRMAEFDQAENPRRAVLLKNAFSLAKERDIQLQMEAAARMLQQRKLQPAIDEQEQARRDMQALLDLLMTENRAERIKDEQARVRDYICEIERLERMQRSVQARTEGGVEVEQLQREQNQVAAGARQLHQKIADTELAENPLAGGEMTPSAKGSQEDNSRSADDSSNESPDSKQGEAGDESAPDGTPKNDAEPDDSTPPGERNPLRTKSESKSPDAGNKLRGSEDNAEQPPAAGEPQDGEPRDAPGGDPTDDEQSSPSEDATAPSGSNPQPSESPSGKSKGTPTPPGPGNAPQGDASTDEGHDSTSAPPQPLDFPGLKRVQEAEQKMQDAELKLAKAKREGAVEDQREASQKLAEAKAELEKILRQMREEEIERVLANLEVRFRKMLEMQLRVYEDTLRVARIPAENRDRVAEIEANKLGFQERRIVVEADKCLAVLREEGSSVAFPESAQQMRDDMQQVTDLLGEANVGRLTQGIEEDIIEALEEMIAALEKAQADQEQRKQDAPAMPTGGPDDMPLVDALAELRMLKALQIRINRRTSRYAAMLDDAEDPVGRPNDDRLLRAVQELAERQQRLQEITRDISMGKNK